MSRASRYLVLIAFIRIHPWQIRYGRSPPAPACAGVPCFDDGHRRVDSRRGSRARLSRGGAPIGDFDRAIVVVSWPAWSERCRPAAREEPRAAVRLVVVRRRRSVRCASPSSARARGAVDRAGSRCQRYRNPGCVERHPPENLLRGRDDNGHRRTVRARSLFRSTDGAGARNHASRRCSCAGHRADFHGRRALRMRAAPGCPARAAMNEGVRA
jgi:hypothetical protein